jgi:hypothetical protein
MALNRARWLRHLKRFAAAWDAMNLSILAIILLVVLWGALHR